MAEYELTPNGSHTLEHRGFLEEREPGEDPVSGGRLIAFPRTAAAGEPWLSKQQIAGHYGRSTRWIELRMREGLPSRMLWRRRAFRLSTVEAWMEARYA